MNRPADTATDEEQALAGLRAELEGGDEHAVTAGPTVGGHLRCITAFMVALDLDGRVLVLPELDHSMSLVRSADEADMALMLAGAKVHVDAMVAQMIAQQMVVQGSDDPGT